MANLELDQRFTHDFSFVQDDVIRFAEASGDKNPIHLNEEYAAQTIFKRRIIHGFLAGSVFSKFFGVEFPGEGTIYLTQNMKFLKPMFTETPYTAEFIIREIILEKKRIKFETNIIDSAREYTIKGDAVVQNEQIFD